MLNYEWSEILDYDESSDSCLRWKIDITNTLHKKRVLVHKGSCAGAKSYRKCGKPKSWKVQYKGKQYSAHRIIYEIFYGPVGDKMIVDHLDRNPFNNNILNLKLKTVAENNRNMSRKVDNKTGVTGVCLIQQEGNLYYLATWSENNKHKKKTFSCKKFGKEQAFKLAIDYRNEMIALLNKKGANYEHNHGK